MKDIQQIYINDSFNLGANKTKDENIKKNKRGMSDFRTLNGHLLNSGRAQPQKWKRGLRNRLETHDFDEKYLENKKMKQFLQKCYSERRTLKYLIN